MEQGDTPHEVTGQPAPVGQHELDRLPPPSLTEQLAFDSLFEAAPLDRLSQRKNVELMHMIPQTGRLLLQLRKCWLVLHDYAVKQGLMDPDGPRRFRVLAKQLFRDIEYDSNDYDTIKKTLTSAISTVVQWGPSAKRKGTNEQPLWQATGLLSDVRFVNVGTRLYIDWSYSGVLVEQLQQQGAWFRFSLSAIRSARTTGGLNLYLLCERYRTNRGGLTNQMEPAVAHALLSGLPVPPPGTPLGREFKYWKRDTVEKWMAEVNSYGEPFRVSMKEIKAARRVVAVQFIVQDAPQTAQAKALNATREAYVERLVQCGISQARAKRFVNEHSDAAIAITTPHLERALRNATPEKPIRSVTGWFATMLERAIEGELEPLEVEPPQPAVEPEVPGTARAPVTYQEMLAKAKADFIASVDGAKAYFESLSPEGQAAIEQQFVEEMKPTRRWATQLSKAYERRKIASPLVSATLWQWMMRRGYQYEPTEAQLLQHAYNAGILVPGSR